MDSLIHMLAEREVLKMGKGRYIWERLADSSDIASQPLPGQPIVELAGDRRVLVENHFGVMEYSGERITVKVKYGCVSVCGCGLQLMHMTREQLVICGRIDGISLMRRE